MVMFGVQGGVHIVSIFTHLNLSMGNIAKFLIPLPPLNEQKRIVAKVDELMKLCDDLEEQIRQSKEGSERLMQVVLQEAFEGKYSEGPDQEVSVA